MFVTSPITWLLFISGYYLYLFHHVVVCLHIIMALFVGPLLRGTESQTHLGMLKMMCDLFDSSCQGMGRCWPSTLWPPLAACPSLWTSGAWTWPTPARRRSSPRRPPWRPSPSVTEPCKGLGVVCQVNFFITIRLNVVMYNVHKIYQVCVLLW